jgi:hypothetical protein
VAELTVPDVFPPDDPVALFCVSMAMAANDVEDAIRAAVDANPDERDRNRFTQRVRLTYGHLFEGLDALKGWRQQEPEVAKLLRNLPPKGAKLLAQVAGLEQKIGPKTIARVRQNTFHYPHPEPSKRSGWVEELGEVVSELDSLPATINMDDTGKIRHTFPFADSVALGLGLRHSDEDHQLQVRDGAVAFVNLVRHVNIAYCKGRGIRFEPSGEDDEFQILTHLRD